MNDRYSDNVEEGVQLIRDFQKLNRRVIGFIVKRRQALNKNAVTPANLVDDAWSLNQLASAADYLRKEAKQLEQLLDKTACAVWVAMCAADPTAPARLEGEIARGTPKVGSGANIPPKGTPAYVSMMKAMGASDAVIGKDVLRPHWPHFCDWLDERAASGLPLPPGIPSDQTYPRYHLVALALKKGVNIEGIENQGDDNG